MFNNDIDKDGQAMNEERHEMHRLQRFNTGAEEWECPECGRRFILVLEPAFQKVILEPGNENAIHCGGTGGITIATAAVQADQEESNLDETTLEPWMRWMDSVDFNSMWNQGQQ